MSTAAPPAGLHVADLSVRLGTVQALAAVTFSLAPGEHLAVVGPSGSGKTTLLRAVAGLRRPDGGTVAWNGEAWSTRDVFLAPRARRVGMVAQDLALWPHLDARRHLLLAMRLRGVAATERGRRADELLALVGLTARATHRPAALSGGEGQRLALARALAAEARLLLLDEPLGQLDVELRRELGTELSRLAASRGASVLHVTHDPADALNTADRVLALEAGRRVQLGTPAELVAAPRTAFVATVTGRRNRIPEGRAAAFRAALGISADDPRFTTVTEGDLFCAPDALCAAPDPAGSPVLRTVHEAGRRLVAIDIAGTHVLVAAPDPHAPPPDRVRVQLAPR